jgi:transcriptional regulator with XRE-family HTH domain
MPRKTPLPDRETAIARRLRAYRAALRLSREAFAQEIGVETAALSRVENLRGPLRAAEAWLALDRFAINPAWLANGQGQPSAVVNLPELAAAGLTGRELYSDAFDSTLAKTDQIPFGNHPVASNPRDVFFDDDTPWWQSLSPSVKDRVTAEIRVLAKLQDWIASVPDAQFRSFIRDLEAWGNAAVENYPDDPSDASWLARSLAMCRLRDDWIARGLYIELPGCDAYDYTHARAAALGLDPHPARNHSLN